MKSKKDDLKFCIIYFAAAVLTLIFWVLAIVYLAMTGSDIVVFVVIIIMTLCFIFFVACGVLFLLAHLSRRRK